MICRHRRCCIVVNADVDVNVDDDDASVNADVHVEVVDVDSDVGRSPMLMLLRNIMSYLHNNDHIN